MTIWTPANAGQLTSNDPEGSNSCVAYSFAYGTSAATAGRVHPTGNHIRDWTGDHLGGLELRQCEGAVEAHTNGAEFQTAVWSHTSFFAKLHDGYGAVLIGGYRPIGASRFAGQRGGTFNHGVWVPPNRALEDPLCDGRKAGVYKYHGEPYPDSLISAFAAALRARDGSLVGADHFEASFVKMATAPTPAVIRHFRVRVDPGRADNYLVKSGTHIIVGRRLDKTGGYSAFCTAAGTYHWPGHGDYRLIRLIDPRNPGHANGARKGRYIAVTSRTHITEV